MVGVPRSKGCARCRQRRKGVSPTLSSTSPPLPCDKKQPSCGQCLAAGATCRGYERDRVFLNSFTGAESEDGLVTTRYKKPTSIGSHPAPDSPAVSLERHWGCPVRLLDNKAAHGLTPQALLATARETQLTGRFLQNYLPSGRPDWKLDSWLEIIPAMQTTDRLAHEALKALSLCNAGRYLDDPSLTRRGLDLYGTAIHHTTRAVQDPVMSRTSNVLAAVKLLYGADKEDKIPVNSWIRHLDGQIAIIMLRPPEVYQTGIEHRLFIGSRYTQVSLIPDVLYNKRYPLNTHEWQTVPWNIISKTPKDLMVDLLIDMSELHVDIHILNGWQSNPGIFISRAKLLDEAYRIQDECQKFSTTWGPLRVFRDDKGEIITCRDQDDYAWAEMTLFHWTSRLFLCQLIRRLHPVGVSVPKESLPSTLIQKIAAAIPFFLEPETGMLGVHRVHFSLGLFLFIMAELNDATAEDIKTMMDCLFDPLVQARTGKFLRGLGIGNIDLAAVARSKDSK
ncbi:hypothetical protein LIA77_09207 [Sarocladium implicatum]|nr:hypothetical protein LIA77_09207 [Sarocladium implicatum]